MCSVQIPVPGTCLVIFRFLLDNLKTFSIDIRSELITRVMIRVTASITQRQKAARDDTTIFF